MGQAEIDPAAEAGHRKIVVAVRKIYFDFCLGGHLFSSAALAGTTSVAL